MLFINVPPFFCDWLLLWSLHVCFGLRGFVMFRFWLRLFVCAACFSGVLGWVAGVWLVMGMLLFSWLVDVCGIEYCRWVGFAGFCVDCY